MSHAQKISPEVKARAVRMVQEHQEDYPSVTAEIKALKAKVRRLEGDNAILKAATTSSWENSTPEPVDHGLHRRPTGRGSRGRVDLPSCASRAAGSRHEPTGRGSTPTVRPHPCRRVVMDAIIATAGTPEGLYGRRKMTLVPAPAGPPGLLRHHRPAHENPGQERDPTRQRPRTTIPAKDGTRVGDLLNRTSPRRHPTGSGSRISPTYRSWPVCLCLFVVDVLAQRIVAWHGATDSARSWCWSRSGWRRGTATGTGHPVVAGELVHHHDAGSQYTSLRFAEHLPSKVTRPRSEPSATPTTSARWSRSSVCSRPSASAPTSSTPGRSGPWQTSSTPPQAGSTGGTTGARTARSDAHPGKFEQAHYAALTTMEQPV